MTIKPKPSLFSIASRSILLEHGVKIVKQDRILNQSILNKDLIFFSPTVIVFRRP